MGFVDADAHVRETDATWGYLSAAEARYRPVTLVAEQGPLGRVAGTPSPDISRYWSVQDQRIPRKDGASARPREAELFPAGTVELEDIPTRLAHMDELGVDVQVLFSTFWISIWLRDPLAERALARSYNRWMAESVASSAGRLRWVLKPPVTSIDDAISELEFGAANGAVAVLMRGRDHGLDLSDAYFWPIYECAQSLGLAIAIHTGVDSSTIARSSGPGLFRSMATVLEAFYSVSKSDVTERFPRLNWGFFEAGAGWAPWLVQNAIRSDEYSLRDEQLIDWLTVSSDYLERRRCFVACFMDDDLEYLASTLGAENLVIGSDWGHYDAGSDPACHRMLVERHAVCASAVHKIVDSNARRLFGISPDFCPTGPSLVTV